MKKIIYLFTLGLALPFFAGCNSNTTYQLEVNAKFCTIEGLKEKYNAGERVTLKINPYPYFELPAQKYIALNGVTNVDYDYANCKISFNINRDATLALSGVSSFGGREVGIEDARAWWNKSTTNVVRLHYRYAFEKVEDPTSAQYKYVLSLINRVFNVPEESEFPLTEFEGEITENNLDKLADLSPFSAMFGNAKNTTYISNKTSSQGTYASNEHLALYSTNIRPAKGVEGVSGCAHWHGGNTVGCDYIYLSFVDVIGKIEEETKITYTDPINGFMEMNLVCAETQD